MLRRSAPWLALALAMLVGGCTGGEATPTAQPDPTAAGSPASDARPSDFARTSIPRSLLRLYRASGRRGDTDWALLAACDQVSQIQALTDEPNDRVRVDTLVSTINDPSISVCATEAVSDLAERFRGLDTDGVPAARGPLAVPAEGRLVARYGMRFGAFHNGIDVAADEGTEIVAPANGLVIYAGSHPIYGVYTCLLHRLRPPLNGRSELTTCFGYQSAQLVDPGDAVAAGEPIGHVGCSGSCVRPALHFQVRDGATPASPFIDPAPFLPDHVGPIKPGRPLDPDP